MDSEHARLENEKLRFENQILQKKHDLSLEEKALAEQKKRNELDFRKEKNDRIKSLLNVTITLLSVSMTFYISAYSLSSTNKMEEKKHWFNLMKWSTDLLKELDDSKTEQRRKTSIAYRLREVNKENKDSEFGVLLVAVDKSNIQRHIHLDSLTQVEAKNKSKAINEEVEGKKNEITQGVSNPSEATRIENKFKEKEQQQIKLEDSLRKNPNDRSLKKQLDTLNNSLPADAEKIAKLLDNLSTQEIELGEFNLKSVASPVTVTWVKEDYYRTFDGIELYVIELNDKKDNKEFAQITITYEENGKPQEEKRKLFTGDKFQIKHQNKLYEIEAVKFGKAGKNPFDKALYFSYRIVPSKINTEMNAPAPGSW